MNRPRPAIIAIIAAVARNGVIGRDNQLLWRLPQDMQHFKRTTLGHPVIMGRKTFESIGRPLPGRRNVVVTRQPDWSAAGVERAGSLDDALALVSDADKAFVIGGEQIYRQALALADELVLTELDADFDGDATFPLDQLGKFSETTRDSHRSDEGYAYHFVTYHRASP